MLTEIEKQEMIEHFHLHYDIEGILMDDEGGVYNPWIYEIREGDSWHSIAGIRIYKADARKRLNELRVKYGDNVRCVRANEVESMAFLD